MSQRDSPRPDNYDVTLSAEQLLYLKDLVEDLGNAHAIFQEEYNASLFEITNDDISKPRPLAAQFNFSIPPEVLLSIKDAICKQCDKSVYEKEEHYKAMGVEVEMHQACMDAGMNPDSWLLQPIEDDLETRIISARQALYRARFIAIRARSAREAVRDECKRLVRQNRMTEQRDGQLERQKEEGRQTAERSMTNKRRRDDGDAELAEDGQQQDESSDQEPPESKRLREQE
jgi:hypothetical protein